MFSKKRYIIPVIILAVCSAGLFLVSLLPKNQPDLLKIPDSDIINLARQNKDVAEYIEKHPDYIIQNRIVLTSEAIKLGRSGQDFREVYSGLLLENNRYMKVDLSNLAGNNGMIIILDFKKNKVDRAFGMMWLSRSDKPNG